MFFAFFCSLHHATPALKLLKEGMLRLFNNFETNVSKTRHHCARPQSTDAAYFDNVILVSGIVVATLVIRSRSLKMLMTS